MYTSAYHFNYIKKKPKVKSRVEKSLIFLGKEKAPENRSHAPGGCRGIGAGGYHTNLFSNIDEDLPFQALFCIVSSPDARIGLRDNAKNLREMSALRCLCLNANGIIDAATDWACHDTTEMRALPRVDAQGQYSYCP